MLYADAELEAGKLASPKVPAEDFSSLIQSNRLAICNPAVTRSPGPTKGRQF